MKETIKKLIKRALEPNEAFGKALTVFGLVFSVVALLLLIIDPNNTSIPVFVTIGLFLVSSARYFLRLYPWKVKP